MATTKKEALEESIKSLTMEYAKKIFENGDSGFDWEDMTGLPIEKELFEEYVNKRKPLLEELYECENPDMCFEDFEDLKNIKFDNIYERIILEYDKLTTDGVYGWDYDNLEPNEEIQKYMREYLKVEDVEDDWVEYDEDDWEEDDEEENIEAKELNEQIDILTEEYIKKIADEIGCEDFVMLITTEDLDDLEDYDEEQQIIIKESYNSPQFKQAKQAFDEFVEKRKPLLLQLIEVLNEEAWEDYNVEEEYKLCMYEYNNDFYSKFWDYVDGDI